MHNENIQPIFLILIVQKSSLISLGTHVLIDLLFMTIHNFEIKVCFVFLKQNNIKKRRS